MFEIFFTKLREKCNCRLVLVLILGPPNVQIKSWNVARIPFSDPNLKFPFKFTFNSGEK